MNECEHTRRLSAYHDGEVTGADREALEAHLAQCPACAAELARLRRLSSLLTQAERPKMPAGVLDRLHRSADDLAAADLRRVAKAFLAAAASILLVCGIWLWQANGAAEPAEAIPVWESLAAHQQVLTAGSEEQLAQWIVQDLERKNGHD